MEEKQIEKGRLASKGLEKARVGGFRPYKKGACRQAAQLTACQRGEGGRRKSKGLLCLLYVFSAYLSTCFVHFISE